MLDAQQKGSQVQGFAAGDTSPPSRTRGGDVQSLAFESRSALQKSNENSYFFILFFYIFLFYIFYFIFFIGGFRVWPQGPPKNLFLIVIVIFLFFYDYFL